MNRKDFQKNESRVRVRRAMRMWIAGAVASLASQATTAAPFPAEIELRDLNPANGGDGSIGVYLEGCIAEKESPHNHDVRKNYELRPMS